MDSSSSKIKYSSLIGIFYSILFLFIFVPQIHADELDELTEFCKNQLCRKPMISLTKEDGSKYEHSIDVPFPVVHKGFISIFPGELLFIEVDSGDGNSLNLKAVSENVNPEKTLILKFWQRKEDKGGMFLKIDNPLKRTVKFHMAMALIKSNKIYETSSCPIKPGLFSIEHWNDVIFQLNLFEGKFLEEDSIMICEF